MAEDKQRFQAQIAGKEYTIVGGQSSEHLTAVTDLINQQLEQLQELDPSLSYVDRLVLMTINAVSDQLNLQKDKLSQEVVERQYKEEIQELKAELSQLRQGGTQGGGRANKRAGKLTQQVETQVALEARQGESRQVRQSQQGETNRGQRPLSRPDQSVNQQGQSQPWLDEEAESFDF